tara:strand:+ start:5089 stop:5370 length:282 start_codon:yes stop_codon:yes gene_type:complete
MPLSRIQVYSLTTASQYVDLTGAGKLIILVEGADVRIGFDQMALDDGSYMVLKQDNTFVFDQPQPFVGQPCYVRADSGTATLRIMVSGGQYGR